MNEQGARGGSAPGPVAARRARPWRARIVDRDPIPFRRVGVRRPERIADRRIRANRDSDTVVRNGEAVTGVPHAVGACLSEPGRGARVPNLASEVEIGRRRAKNEWSDPGLLIRPRMLTSNRFHG